MILLSSVRPSVCLNNVHCGAQLHAVCMGVESCTVEFLERHFLYRPILTFSDTFAATIHCKKQTAESFASGIAVASVVT